MQLSKRLENKWGNAMYEPNANGEIYELNPLEIWTIDISGIAPIQGNNTPKDICSVRRYGDHLLLMSHKAAEVIPAFGEGGGSICILSYWEDGERYFILVGDNKSYIMNCGGGINPGESGPECACREIREELNIVVDPSSLVYYAEYAYIYRNDIIGPYEWDMVVNCYHAEIQAPQYQATPGSVSVIDASGMGLSETQYIYIVPASMISEFEGAAGKRYAGHHKKLILDLLGIENSIDVNYIKKFKYV